MKTVAFILFVSLLALGAVAALAGRPPRHAGRAAPAVSAAAWREISGARPILPARFVPPLAARVAAALPVKLPPDKGDGGQRLAPARWTLPLMDRPFTHADRTENLAPEMQEIINRVEPLYDPTRLDGPLDAVPLRVSSGTATLGDVFGEHWRLASDDPNVEVRVAAIGLGWTLARTLPCDAFIRHRPRTLDDLALDALSPADCAAIHRRRARRFDDAQPIAITAAAVALPAFAAPPPGGRQSSSDFWAAQKARVEAVEARLEQKWETARPTPAPAAPPR